MKSEYEDIIEYEHPISKKHKSMPVNERAAQFAPFAALTGYNDAIDSRKIKGVKMPEMSEDEFIELDAVMQDISTRESPEVEVKYFKLYKKDGKGYYARKIGTLKKMDEYGKKLIFTDGDIIQAKDVLKLELVDNSLPHKNIGL